MSGRGAGHARQRKEACMKRRLRRTGPSNPEPVAGNGLLNRRLFLEGIALTGAMGATAAAAEPLTVPKWSKEPGAGFEPYGKPSRFEDKVVRVIPPPPNPVTVGIGTART